MSSKSDSVDDESTKSCPEFLKRLKTQEALHGQDVTFECQVAGNPSKLNSILFFFKKKQLGVK
jgi:hypothetical protein